jgi:hypothetical protein
MIRRILSVGTLLLLIVLSVSACQKDNSTKKAPTVQDPDAGEKPPVNARGG